MIASLLNLPIDYIFGAKFAIQFAIAVGLYTYSLSCKKYFWWRLLGCLCVAALTPFINEFTSVLLPKFSIVMAFFYIYSLFVIHFLFNISWMNALFCWISACATQFVVSQSYAFFDVLFGAFAADILEFIVFVVFYLFCYFFFARRIQNDGIGNINNARLTVLSAGIWLIADIVCNLGRSFLWETPLSAVYGVCCGLFILIIEFGLMRESKIEQDKKLIEQLLCQEEAQHRITQEAVEYIDIKSHDLKHEIECLRSMGRGENFEHIIGDIEKKVLEYEDIVKTENQTLNVVLTEKNLYCRRYGVKLYYMIDGKALDFMESQDLFSLFGNILDNAIECLVEETEENRSIDLNVFKKGNMAVITATNRCTNGRKFQDGLPVTTKQDVHFHGYGTKSIRYIAEKYGGNAVFDLKNDKFSVSVILPIQQ